MKKVFFLSLILFLVFSIIVVAENDFNKIDRTVYQKIDSGKEVRVFIKYQEDQNNKKSLSSIEESIDEKRVRHKFEDKVSAVINSADLEKLKNNPLVEGIELVGSKRIFLQDSVPLINGTVSHSLQLDGINLTGKDQTICILDTGVNYTHPDLGGCYGNNTNFSCKIVGGWDYVNGDSDPMDDEGHGTHVSGIVAGSGGITGVAPEANIVMIKVCNTENCWDDDIRAGIDWCVNNASKFNISVISMSLGADLYYDYCDYINDSANITLAINNAVAKNISVVIATGNGLNNVGPGRGDQISSPACIQNATPVGATTKVDGIASYSNRNNLTLLMAPGSSINSTSWNGNYELKDGTSMATPHVAGTIALINQYLKLNSRTKTPEEIELVLNRTGKIINDASSGINYSRMDIFSAIISLDSSAPNVTLVSPENNSNSANVNQTFICNSTDLRLNNLTFYLWNSSSDLINSTFEDFTNSGFHNFEINVSNLSRGSYKWNCLFEDETGNSAFASSNYTLSINPVQVILITPNNSLRTNQNQTFNCNVSSIEELSNITFYLWNSTGIENTSVSIKSGLENSSSYNYNFSHEDSYKWDCLGYDVSGNSAFASSNYSLNYGTTIPVVTLVSPSNDTSQEEGTIHFQFNVSDSQEILQCYSVLNGVIGEYNSTFINQSSTNTISYSVGDGNYNWSINCTDIAGNMGNSATRELNLTATPQVQQNNGGGGSSSTNSFWTKVYSAAAEDFEVGYTHELAVKERIKVRLGNEDHHVGVILINKTSAKINISSKPQQAIFTIGEVKNFDVNEDNILDLSVKLNSIKSNKANVTVTQISIPISLGESTTNSSANETNQTGSGPTEDTGGTRGLFWNIAIIIVLVIAGIVFYLFERDKKGN